MKEKKDVFDFLSDSKVFHILLSIVIGFVVGALFLIVMKIPVGKAYGRLFSVFTNIKSISYVIVYSAPYVIVGLSVAFSFRTGVFNIGAEGQFVIGSITAAVIGILFGDLPGIILIPLCMIAAAAAGAIWGMIVGLLKAKCGINEVLSMIMFNWIAFYLSNFIIGIPAIHSDGTAEATKNVSEHARTLLSQKVIDDLGLCPTANWGILVAALAMVIVWFIIEKTTLGYRLKAVGFNKYSAEYGGIDVDGSILTALAISGALSGLAGSIQLLGMGGRISVFTSQEGFGFAGIVVALIGCSNPFGVMAAGIFYGALTYGGTKLNLEGAPTQVVNIIVGTVVFFIAIASIFQSIRNLKPKKKEPAAVPDAAGDKKVKEDKEQ